MRLPRLAKLHILRPLALRRAYRKFKVAILGEAEVVGFCLRCGNCCRELVLYADGGWITTEEQFRRFVDRNPEYDRLYVKDCDLRGFLIFACSWLTEEGLCKDHVNRMELCSDHPSPDFYTCGAELTDQCGFSVKAPSWRRLWPWRRTPRDFGAALRIAAQNESENNPQDS